MIRELFGLLDYVQETAIIVVLCWVRIWIVFKVVPLLSGEGIPALARNAITLAIALVLYPTISVAYGQFQQDNLLLVGIVIVKEAFLGLLIGYTISMVFWKISGVGFFIDNQRGASMASSLNPMIGEQDSPIGIFLSQVMVTIFFTSGGILLLIDGLYKSYVLWPPLSYFPSVGVEQATHFLGLLDDLMYVIVFLAAPVIISMFIAEFGLAVVGRFAPQLNVFFLAMPIKSGIAVAILCVYLVVLIKYFDDEYVGFKYIAYTLDRVFQ